MTKAKTESVSDDDLYRHSSQFRLWSFTKDDLRKKQQETHDKAEERLRKDLEERGFPEIELLSFDEEQKLIRVYASKIDDISRTFKMPSQVRATATSYFRKFYLVNSVMDHHPKNIMYTCVFLASKSENFFVGIDDFCKTIPRTVPKEILGLEFLILQSLSFTLSVHSGLRPLHGFFLDIQGTLEDVSTSELCRIYNEAKHTLMSGLITNAMFYYTPPQMALAAMAAVNEDVVTRYLEKKYGGVSSPVAEELAGIIDDCKTELLDCTVPGSEEGKGIDKKLYMSLYPEKYLNSAKRKLDKESESRSASPSDGGDSKRVKVAADP
ncbi:cyclin Ccl1p [Trichomonascus vanleenenianus]|uniref:TFIIH complex kinase subunit CCL1 n=1 Tax=Trichomonascus vanleenenianus TaxID=2268995 RepID=UPI003ECA6589